MSNFTGMIGSDFKQLHVDMITELIRGCAVTCTLSFGISKWINCANCVFDPVGNKSANRYQTGGPMPFTFGTCPMCYGEGKIPDEQSSTVSLAPVYDYKDWVPLKSNVQSPEGFVQTLSLYSTFEVLRRAKDVIIDTATNASTKTKFEKYGEPEPCGIGASSFILCMWKRIENG